jgi:hypothetical protein
MNGEPLQRGTAFPLIASAGPEANEREHQDAEHPRRDADTSRGDDLGTPPAKAIAGNLDLAARFGSGHGASVAAGGRAVSVAGAH